MQRLCQVATAMWMVLAGILAGCAPVLPGALSSTTPPTTAGQFGKTLSGGILSRAVDLGPVSPCSRVSLLLLLADPGRRQLEADLTAMYDPHSRRFGHFLSLRQIVRSGPRRTVVSRTETVLWRLGLVSHWSPGDSWLGVSGTVARIQHVFAVPIHRFQAPNGRRFVAGTHDPIVPSSLRRGVSGASRIQSYTYLQSRDVPSQGLTPADLLTAYDITPLRAQGVDGTGQTVVFFEIDGFRQSDFDSYTSRFHLSPLKPVIKAGPKLTPGGEAPMDLEAVHAIAPGARLLVYNLDQAALGKKSRSDAQFLDSLIAFQRKIVNENPGAIISNSVGSCAAALGKGAAGVLRQVYDRADALGEAWFAASGDQGAYDCLQSFERAGDPPSGRDVGVDLPASAPGVTGVGGTRLSVRTDGTWYAEEAWEGPVETSGGGGGVSEYFSRPSWQRAPGVGNLSLDKHRMREVPDVSAIADPATSGTYAVDGQYSREGGTSQAAPIWAGIMALANQYMQKHGGHKLGFANPALYSLARTKQLSPAFHDVTDGSNLLYPATPGYDMATGLGTPDAFNLARDLLAYEGGEKP